VCVSQARIEPTTSLWAIYIRSLHSILPLFSSLGSPLDTCPVFSQTAHRRRLQNSRRSTQMILLRLVYLTNFYIALRSFGRDPHSTPGLRTNSRMKLFMHLLDISHILSFSPQFKRIAAFQGDFLFTGARRFLLEHASKTQNTWSWCMY
jgi:hypothetical protein